TAWSAGKHAGVASRIPVSTIIAGIPRSSSLPLSCQDTAPSNLACPADRRTWCVPWPVVSALLGRCLSTDPLYPVLRSMRLWPGLTPVCLKAHRKIPRQAVYDTFTCLGISTHVWCALLARPRGHVLRYSSYAWCGPAIIAAFGACEIGSEL